MNLYLKKIAVPLALIAILAIPLIQVASAQSMNTTNAPEKTLAFLSEVAGLDLSKYTVDVHVSNASSNGLFDTVVNYNFTNANSKFNAMALFRNNALVWCKIYPTEGSPIFIQQPSTDSVTNAMSVLGRYQTYSNKPYLSAVQNLLKSTPEFTNQTLGDITQKTTVAENTQSVEWSYTVNGIANGYDTINLEFENGRLEFFQDNWNLYLIGSTDINVSSTQTVQTAISRAETAYSTTLANGTVSNVVVLAKPVFETLSMQNRGNNTLYPLWDLLLPLDKVYSGAITSVRVSIWADTGQVDYMAGTGPGGGIQPNAQVPSSTSSVSSDAAKPLGYNFLIIPALVCAAIVLVGYLLYTRKSQK